MLMSSKNDEWKQNFWPFQGGTSFVDLFMFFFSCVCYVFVRVCLYVLCGHLLGKGWPLGFRLRCLFVNLSSLASLCSWAQASLLETKLVENLRLSCDKDHILLQILFLTFKKFKSRRNQNDLELDFIYFSLLITIWIKGEVGAVKPV